MIYSEASMLLSSSLEVEQQNSFTGVSNSEGMASLEELIFFKNLIHTWLYQNRVIIFDVAKLTTALSIGGYSPPVRQVVSESVSDFKQISTNLYLCQYNLHAACLGLISAVLHNSSTFVDQIKTNLEVTEIALASIRDEEQKKKSAALILERLSAIQHQNVKCFPTLGFYFATVRCKSPPKDVLYSVLKAKTYMETQTVSNDRDTYTYLHNFLNFMQTVEHFESTTLEFKETEIQNECAKVNRLVNENLLVKKYITNSISTPNLSSVLLTLSDVEVTNHDLQTLQGKNWVNDKIIHFHGRLIEKQNNSIYFIPPCTGQFLRFYDENDVKEAVKNWNISETSIVLAPLTNARSLQATGNHWSLLVWLVGQNRFLHCDSLSGNKSNITAAKFMVSRFVKIFKLDRPHLAISKVPQQKNTHDCGLYLIAFMEHIANTGGIDGLEECVSEGEIGAMRGTLMKKMMNIGSDLKQ